MNLNKLKKKKEKAIVDRSSSFLTKKKEEEKPIVQEQPQVQEQFISIDKIAIFGAPILKDSEFYSQAQTLGKELVKYKPIFISTGQQGPEVVIEAAKSINKDIVVETTAPYKEAKWWLFLPGSLETTALLMDIWYFQQCSKENNVTLSKIMVWNTWKGFVSEAKKQLKLREEDKFFVVIDEISDIIKVVTGQQ